VGFLVDLESIKCLVDLERNYSKSMMIPINIEESKMSILANTLGCSIGAMSFTYLGLPLGTTKPQVSDFLPLISKCERRLISTSRFLSQAGRLQMTNAVLSALPTFHLCTFKMHKTVLHQIDKYRKHCLWRGADINAKTPPKAAWDSVCVVWTSLGPLPRWVPGPTTRWAPGTTRLALHGT
jgi:hypothetical protein